MSKLLIEPLAEDASQEVHAKYGKHVDDDCQAKCYILASMNEELQNQHEHMMHAADMISHLQELYGEGTRNRRFSAVCELLKTVASCLAQPLFQRLSCWGQVGFDSCDLGKQRLHFEEGIRILNWSKSGALNKVHTALSLSTIAPSTSSSFLKSLRILFPHALVRLTKSEDLLRYQGHSGLEFQGTLLPTTPPIVSMFGFDCYSSGGKASPSSTFTIFTFKTTNSKLLSIMKGPETASFPGLCRRWTFDVKF
ncbi:hypothetical protein GBA52_010442 [Prunus armeniaca]|nr:hypothetical protein GBA52_010442 [Prunus armeniaca]